MVAHAAGQPFLGDHAPVSILSDGQVHALGHYGYGAIALAVGVESIGIPVPGETMLIAAALYAGATHQLSIVLVVLCAACGAILGDSIGFWLGRVFGVRLLVRFGPRVGITLARIRLGRYLFRRHGGKVVFFGRFVALLRALAAILAGANGMPWARFLLFNAAGGLAWTALYGFGAYALGKQVHRLAGPVGIAVTIVAAVLVAAWFIFLRRNEARLQAEADRLFAADAARLPGRARGANRTAQRAP